MEQEPKMVEKLNETDAKVDREIVVGEQSSTEEKPNPFANLAATGFGSSMKKNAEKNSSPFASFSFFAPPKTSSHNDASN